jgi:hypothetical protein
VLIQAAQLDYTPTINRFGGYAFALPPGIPKKLYVGTYKTGEPKPTFDITLEPADREAVVHSDMVAEQKDGHYRLYYYFENYGLVTVRVRMKRVG